MNICKQEGFPKQQPSVVKIENYPKEKFMMRFASFQIPSSEYSELMERSPGLSTVTKITQEKTIGDLGPYRERQVYRLYVNNDCIADIFVEIPKEKIHETDAVISIFL